MKKITTLLLALVVVLFTQCKKDNIDSNDNDNETRKVKVRCEIPLGNGSRSDFSNLMTDGSIKWSTGTERIYLAVHHVDASKAQIVELTAETTQTATILAFEGEVDETILTTGETYNVWYLGNSMNLETPYVTKNEENGLITSVSGSIANQNGSLADLGYHHIAKAEVTATLETDGSYTLPLNGTLQNQIAIAYMDLTNVTKLSGNAIIGTDYSLEYSGGEYKFVINENNNEINITSNQSSSASFVVLLPNENTNVDITTDLKKYTFKDGIAASNLYYRYISDVEVGTLKWEYYPIINGYEFVDLGLPSGTLWATRNVGADNPWDDGDYFAWGETSPKASYTWDNYRWGTQDNLTKYNSTDGITTLEAVDDAATVNMGADWKTPTADDWTELMNNCTWTWTTLNGVKGYNIAGDNGNSIFLPAAGAIANSSKVYANSQGLYWANVIISLSETTHAYFIDFKSIIIAVSDQGNNRCYGMTIRAIKKQ